MRLLSTDRAELHFFASPEDVPGGYAILSHVWDEHEDTFQDVESLRVECASSGRNPRDLVSEKIRKSCILAEKHDYKWIWVDTCCIDKSSSAELSEAINSMYRYYAHSAICYAFLRDVRSRYRMNNIWYKRGWTLQELIAPRLLVFVSHKWEVLGTKGDLASNISSQTQIPEEVLRHEKDLAYVPVGQRMSWASRRDTTRVEDRAYSLMGIFGINMPTLYGEGHNAFYRLQEEIMKVSTDPTLFSWGRYNIIKSSLYAYIGDESPGAGSEGASAPPGGTSALLEGSDSLDAQRKASRPCKHLMTGERSLLAPSPSEFAGRMYSLSVSGTDDVQGELASMIDYDIPSFEMTPHGVRAYLPVVKHSAESPDPLVALLSFANDQGSYLIGLHLFRCIHTSTTRQSTPVFHVGEQSGSRLVFFKRLGEQLKPFWTKFYISGKPPFRSTVDTLPRSLTYLQLVSASPFRIVGGAVAEFGDPERVGLVTIDGVSNIPVGWAGDPPLAVQLLFKRESIGSVYILVTLGCCQRAGASKSWLDWGMQWANVRFGRASTGRPEKPDWDLANVPNDSHRCDRDHIVQWPKAENGCWRRSYAIPLVDSAIRLVLVFATCPLNARGKTLMLKKMYLEWEDEAR